MPGRSVLTLGDNLPSRRGLTWRRGYERAASSAWDKDRPPSSPLLFSASPPPSATPDSVRRLPPSSLAPRLPATPDPECLFCTSRLIAHFCKLVSISMLHLLAFNIFARPCRKKRGAQQKANPPTALSGKTKQIKTKQKTRSPGLNKNGVGGRGGGAEGVPWRWVLTFTISIVCCALPKQVTQETSQTAVDYGGTKPTGFLDWLIITYSHRKRTPHSLPLSKSVYCISALDIARGIIKSPNPLQVKCVSAPNPR